MTIRAKMRVAYDEFSVAKSENDKNFTETVKRAELQAVAKALGQIATEIVSYLDSVPAQ